MNCNYPTNEYRMHSKGYVSLLSLWTMIDESVYFFGGSTQLIEAVREKKQT